MRVCFVSHSSGRGGAEEVLLETLEMLTEHGFECCVLMPGDLGLGEDLRKLGVPFHSFPYWNWMGHSSAWKRFQVAARNVLLSVPAALTLRRWKPDLIYSNTMTVCFGAILAKMLRRPHVWHLHELGYEDHGLTFDFGPKLSYRVINSASACLAVSEITARTFAKNIERSKIRVIYQSVYRQPLWPEPNKLRAGDGGVPAKRHKIRCVIVGRISEGKRQEDAVIAMADLKELGVDAELLIIGRSNPGYTEKLQSLMRAHRVEDRVTIVGTVPDRMPFVQSADIILMCSRCEAFGRVTVEGMLAGKPVIAANTGANPEIIREGFNGLMYEFGDTKDLADRIKYLSENPALAREIGQNGLTWSQSYYSKERYANELIPFLNGVVDHEDAVPAEGVGEDKSLPCK